MQTGCDEIHQEGGGKCLLISLTSLGRLKGGGEEGVTEIGSHPNRHSVAPTSNLPL